MQFAKDSFYMALRTRLAALNPSRTVSVDGVDRTAVSVRENSADNSEAFKPETFYLTWGACRPVPKLQCGPHPLLALECTISYWTAGTSEAGVDRGRVLGQLDTELIAICHPLSTGKQDYTKAPAVDLGTSVFWTPPSIGTGQGEPSLREIKTPSRALLHSAAVTVHFFPEVDLL
jgi:hypothetical protein